MYKLSDVQFFDSNTQPLGRVVEHPLYPSGELIRTSDIMLYNKKDQFFVTSNNSVYFVESFFDGLSKRKMESFSDE